MNSDRIINILAGITLVELMVTIGLDATVQSIRAVLTDWSTVARAAVANYVIVPGIAVGLLLLFRASPAVAAGFLIVSVCPGAPYAPPFTAIARGDVARAVGLMVILAGSSAIFAPVLLKLLLPLVAGDAQANINAGRIVGTLAVVQFLPLCIGLFLRSRYAPLAIRLGKPFRLFGMLLNVTLIGVILVAQSRMLSAIHLTGYLGMLALLAGSILAGWLLGGPGRAGRDTLAITTSVRNVGVALVIAGGSFPGTPAVTSTTAYALFQTVVVALLVIAYGQTKTGLAKTAQPVDATVEATSPVSDNA